MNYNNLFELNEIALYFCFLLESFQITSKANKLEILEENPNPLFLL